MSVIPFKASEISAATRNVIAPSKFEGKSTSDNGSPHVFAGAGELDVVFVDVDFVASGDFTYIGGVLTYIGTDTLESTMNLSCSVECNSINTNVHLAQFQNGVEIKGSQNVSKAESNVSKVPFSIDAPFTLNTGDALNLKIKVDKACTVTLYHFSVVLEPNKIILA